MTRVALQSAIRLLGAVSAAVLLAAGGTIRPTLEAQTTTNPIVAENAQEGTPQIQWDIEGSGDPDIQGFATDISVNTGQSVSFKVKTTASNYTIDIYRLGYYNGAGGRKLTTLVRSTPQTQPACSVDGVTGLADCGNWAVSATWDSTGATSGVYVAKLTRSDNGGASHIYFIVRDDSRQADIVFQTSDTTWQAYNRYGGGSLYCDGPTSNAGTLYACPGRATKVSYNRPFDTRDHDSQSFLFNAEYPMVRFLEANGYDVKYISGVDTERGAANLMARKPKAFLSVGHDEYWSSGQRASVKAARDAGVSLAFFSGNEMYWKTRFENAPDGTPYRTLVSYKDTLGGVKLDPAPGVTTGTWRDTRFAAPVADGGKPENALTGQIWTVNSGTSAISVPAAFAKLRFWKHTRVENITSGSVTLAADTLGYEWDEDLDNGFRPDGLIRLSATTVSGVEKILDFGETVGIGTATHNLTLYRHASGALVFGAGTVQWAWGLDSNHDRGATPPDQAMQQATVNLLADMGVQPGTLQDGADGGPLVAATMSTDTLAPTSTTLVPAIGSSVEAGAGVTISGTATDSSGIVAGVEVSVDDGVTWHGANLLSAGGTWTYEWTPQAPGTAYIRSRAVDDSGNIESPSPGVIVSVFGGACPCTSLWKPTAVPANPSFDDLSAYELGVKFKSDVDGSITGIRFYKGALSQGQHVGNLWTSSGQLLATAAFTNETESGWQQVSFDSPVPIIANTTYVASYHVPAGGRYAFDSGYFASAAVDSPPLHALPTGPSGGNGVFANSVTSAFPTSTFNANNYWVDVVFAPTLPGSTLRDTRPPDFNAGAGSHTYVSEIADGEVILQPTTGSEFSGPSLSSGWINVPYAGGAPSFADGSVLVDGSRLGTCVDVNGACQEQWTLTPGHRLEFIATFTDEPFQHSGFAQDFSSSAQPWAMFSTGGSDRPSRELYARTNTGTAFIDTPLGAGFVGFPHKYTIDWNGASIVYSIDGSVVATHGLAVSGPMRLLAASDFDMSAKKVAVDWMRVTPYVATGTFESRVFDAGHVVNWNTILWTADAPEGTSVGISVRTGSTNTPGVGTWSDWQEVSAPGSLTSLSLTSRYIQYRATLSTANTDVTPQLDNIVITTGHPPVAAPDSIVVPVNGFVTLPASGPDSLVVNDSADNPDALKVSAAGPASHGTVEMNFDGSVKYTPNLDYIGPDSFLYTVSDGLFTSSALVTVNVGSANDAPAAADGSLTTTEDTPATGTLTATDADGDALTFTLVADAGNGVVTVIDPATGAYSYLPNANFHGSDSFTFKANDGNTDSNVATVAVTVTAANDAPSFTKGADRVVLEDAAAQSIADWATGISAGPTDESGQVLNFVLSNNNNALFAVQPAVAANGTLTFTPAANANGVATVTVQLHDNGGTANGGVDTSAAQTFTITVTPVNDAPSFTKGANQSVSQNAGPQSVANWATNISAGPSDESGQALNFLVTNNATALFAAQPAIAANGTLTFTPAANANGVAMVTVQLHDDGGGTDTSAPQTFTITITAVTPSLSIGDASIIEGNSGSTNMTFTVTLAAASSKTVTVNYATANGSAVAPSDYKAKSGSLTFLAGSVSQTISVQVNGNTIDTPDKTFFVNLSSPVNATIADAQGIGTIIDNDTSTVTFTTSADFLPAATGTYVSETANGEVMLQPALGTEFSGTTLPSGWVSSVVTPKGSYAVSNGTVRLNGMRITSPASSVSVGQSIEFLATLDKTAQQNVGLLPAQFVARVVGGKVNLYARADNAPDILVPGNWFGAPHRFRIDWTSTGSVYWIDGVKVATQLVVASGTTTTFVASGDVSKGGGVLTVDWVRATPYAATATYMSKVFDAAARVTWQTISWSAETPVGTNLVVSYRTGHTATPDDGTWTAWTTVPASGGALTGSSQYIQYRLEESTTDAAQSPAVNDVVLTFNR